MFVLYLLCWIGVSDNRVSTCNAGDRGLTPRLGKAWQATVPGVTKYLNELDFIFDSKGEYVSILFLELFLKVKILYIGKTETE